VYNMPPRCKICDSPNREEYEKWLLSGSKTLRECSNDAKAIYNEIITFVAFHRHKQHMTQFIERAISAEEKVKLRKAKVFKEAFDSASRLKENIDILSSMLTRSLQKANLTLKEMNTIKGLLGEIRFTSTALDSMQDKYLKAESSEEEIMKFIEAIEREAPDMASRLLEIYLGVSANAKKGKEEPASG